jgi:hypothetical protein
MPLTNSRIVAIVFNSIFKKKSKICYMCKYSLQTPYPPPPLSSPYPPSPSPIFLSLMFTAPCPIFSLFEKIAEIQAET